MGRVIRAASLAIFLLTTALIVTSQPVALALPPDDTPTFTEHEFRAHLNFLGGDLCEGRAVGTRGGEVAAAYIAAQFQAAGLQPISPEAGYFQQVPLKGITTDYATAKFSLFAGDREFPLTPVEDVVLNGEKMENAVTLDDELIFVGYGIVAPEFNWDDYKGVDITGKTVVMLVNDPDFAKTGFGSESLTFYGRWTYKEIIASARGAKALILLHTDESAAYGMNVVRSSWTIERISFADDPRAPLMLKAWVSQPAADKVLAAVNLSYAQLKEKAESRDFKPFPLGLRVVSSFNQTCRTTTSPNVAGILPGTTMKDEVVVFTGHYDHLGIGMPDAEGDTIYNGASDNASGTAAIICLARAFAQGPAPQRTLVFLAVTGEESGLLGSDWYAAHPVFPLDKHVVAINKDVVNLLGATKGFGAAPVQYSDALPVVTEIGKSLGLDIFVSEVDRGGGAFRSDHFPFAARGIVAMSVGLRGEYRNLSQDQVAEIRKKIGYTYHQPNDEVSPHWNYDGAMLELNLLWRLGRHWADGAPKPQLKEGNPYEATMRLFGSSN